MSQPRQLDHPLYHLLHNDDVKGFNAQKPKGVEVDLSGGDFRGLDLRNMDTDAVNFNDAYFRGQTCAAWTSAMPRSKGPAWPTRRFLAPTFQPN